ncbi:DOMON domain-containing protein [Desulfogranum mediterraneum]|uniref:DOMON domain-containing protein n=1 Tax=Desulfogranum mediterraneum TaxID=160661 RepID=UPI0003FA2827|nr:DOMON domain-containing protein [Desulfogranum mediterraneum]
MPLRFISSSRYPALLLSLVIALATQAATASGADYQHSLSSGKMTFDWSVAGETLAVRLTAPTKGWLGIGFNPSKQMKDADFVVGYVKKGKVAIFDEVGTQATRHGKDKKKGGQDNVTLVGGSEQGKSTTLEFTIPLNSGDQLDSSLDPAADTVVLLAYGPDRDSTRMKHVYQARLVVNLSSGAVK